MDIVNNSSTNIGVQKSLADSCLKGDEYLFRIAIIKFPFGEHLVALFVIFFSLRFYMPFLQWSYYFKVPHATYKTQKNKCRIILHNWVVYHCQIHGDNAVSVSWIEGRREWGAAVHDN